MTKLFHEIRDPIHVFIHLDWYEKKVLDSRPFQRLRNITQLALTYLLYTRRNAQAVRTLIGRHGTRESRL
jgi:hypothetical protein